jgi:hypothetical protein
MGRYGELQVTRDPVLQRAREAARLTIPALVPPMGSTSSTRLPTPWQSIGARGVNNLSSKLLLSLFPPNQPFFRLEIGEFAIQQLTGRPDMKAEVDKALAKIEREVQTEVETTAVRTSAAEALKHLIVAGNVLIYMLPVGGLRVFHLGDYVCHRDPSGSVLEIITHERVSPAALPDNLKHLAKSPDGKGGSVEKTLDLYTWIRRRQNQWTIRQEIKNEVIPGSQGTYPLDKSPWLPLRWTRVDGEDYGRGLVEEYQGDLQTLEGLTQAIAEGAAAAAKVIVLVNPNGTTKQKTISEAPNGAVREGREEDVKFVQAQKHGDFATAQVVIKDITERLSYAFMLNSAIQRQGERVTAEEIRFMAQELETTQGGLYSILSQEFQLPFVKRLMFQMERAQKLPPLPAKAIRPTIVTGLEALGRGNDLQKLQAFIGDLVQLGTAKPQLLQRIRDTDLLDRLATARGIDTEGLIISDEEMAQQAQQEQQNATMQNLAPHLIRGASQVAAASVKQAPQAPAQAQPAGDGG